MQLTVCAIASTNLLSLGPFQLLRAAARNGPDSTTSGCGALASLRGNSVLFDKGVGCVLFLVSVQYH